MARRSRSRPTPLWLGLAMLLLSASLPLPAAAVSRLDRDPRLFVETGFRVSNDGFWDYFTHRGGVRTFGFPISRQFLLRGAPAQFFQRAVMLQRPDGSVALLNLLDDDVLPVTRIGFATFPAPDPEVVARAPRPGSPDYSARLAQFLQETVPNEFDGKPVGFLDAFLSTVTLDDAFPQGGGSPDLLPMLNLEVWGPPTSLPASDPFDPDHIYQRFQRGVLHYDHACGCTSPLLLADYLKAAMTGERLPPDLASQAAGSPFFQQYAPGQPRSLARPQDLPDTDLTDAFTPDLSVPPEVAATIPTPAPTSSAVPPQPPAAPPTVVQPGQPLPSPAPAAAPAAAIPPSGSPASSFPVPYRAASPEYGMGVFVSAGHDPAAVVGRVKALGFSWVKVLVPWREVEGRGKGQFDWSRADALLGAARQQGLKTLARVDFPPGWARRDGANNGPPDNYQDYADFVAALARRYGAGSPLGQLDAIEVWNEPNLSREWGNQPISPQSARDYVRLLSLSYQAIKAVDPRISVVTAGLSPTGWNDETARPDDVYLEWLYQAGLAGHYDVLGAHAPGFKAPPEVSPAEAAADPRWGGHRSFTFRRVEDLRAIMERHGEGAKQIWVLEFGWTSDRVHPAYAWHAVSEQEKGEYLVRAFQWARQHWAPWIGVMLVWNLPDPTWGPQDEQYWWGIAEPDGTPRPAYTLLQQARQNGTLP